MATAIRLARPEDLDDVGRVTVEAYRDDGYLAHSDSYLRVLADAAGRSRDAELWVAVDGSGILGSVTFCRPGSRFAEIAREDEAEFRMLGVTRPARRRGVANALVVRCIERARELGYAGLVMSSMREMSAAHRLYERLGFVRIPERDWSPVAGVRLEAFRLPLG